MSEFAGKSVLVIGLDPAGAAACRLLKDGGATVSALDAGDSGELRKQAAALESLGITVELGAKKIPGGGIDFAVLGPLVSPRSPLAAELAARGIPATGEFELGCQQSRCLGIAVAGTNGKRTTAKLIELIMGAGQRKTLLCGHGARPVCDAVGESRHLDNLILTASALQLETTEFFRPVVAVLMNATPDNLDRFGGAGEYERVLGRLFANQQAFDWAIVQSEALAGMQEHGIPIPGKIITFSAGNRAADIYYDRGLITSRIPGWSGPLLDMDHCRMTGLHNAENLMAALAVGHVMRVGLETMAEVLKQNPQEKQCFETIAEIDGVKYIDDSKSANPDSLQKALLSIPPGAGGGANIWLIAGGRVTTQDYHQLGPLISQRVKGVALVGGAAAKIRPAWSLFTPCTAAVSLLEAIAFAVKSAVPGDVILLSPACPGFDQIQDAKHPDGEFRGEVKKLAADLCGRDGSDGAAADVAKMNLELRRGFSEAKTPTPNNINK
jgi:UDP-N-acetylmuramoylalanine--D-glutamate ligase